MSILIILIILTIILYLKIVWGELIIIIIIIIIVMVNSRNVPLFMNFAFAFAGRIFQHFTALPSGPLVLATINYEPRNENPEKTFD
jgi:hypothetical protein